MGSLACTIPSEAVWLWNVAALNHGLAFDKRSAPRRHITIHFQLTASRKSVASRLPGHQWQLMGACTRRLCTRGKRCNPLKTQGKKSLHFSEMWFPDSVNYNSFPLWIQVVDMHNQPPMEPCLVFSAEVVTLTHESPEKDNQESHAVQKSNWSHKHPRRLLPSVVKLNGFRKRASPLLQVGLAESFSP